jgi:hypothetical protein
MVVANDKNGTRYYDHKLTALGKGKLLDLAAGITIPPPSQGANQPNAYADKRLAKVIRELLTPPHF